MKYQELIVLFGKLAAVAFIIAIAATFFIKTGA